MTTRENQFPYVVNTLADLSEEFQRAVQSCLPKEDSIHSILMLPPQPFMKRGGVPRQVLLSTTHGILHVRDGRPLSANYLPAKSLLYVHRKLILLYGYMELAGEVNGELAYIIVEYNTVGQSLLNDALRLFLQMSYGMVQPVASIQEQNDVLLQKLGTVSFKFTNGLRLHALQPDERLLGYVYQPRIRQSFLHFFSRPIAPASMLALTDQAVILIEEDKAWGASYGLVITLCPRKVVESIESQSNREWRNIYIHLARNTVALDRQVMLENDKTLKVEALWSSSKQSDKRKASS
jgi:hypothetical protein